MAYKNTVLSTPNKRRGPYNKTSITIHYWGTSNNFNAIVSWLRNPKAKVSAQYVVEAGRVTQLVGESEVAWHSGSNQGNKHSIGIECRPRCSKADLETVAELIANIRRRRGNLPLKMHKQWKATSCPGPYEKYMKWLDRRANEILAGKKPSTPAPSTPSGSTGLVEITASRLNVRSGPSTKYRVVTSVKKGGVFTIVDTKNGWGKLKSGAGWIALNYTKKASTSKAPARSGNTVEITASRLNVRSGPSTKYRVVTSVKKGEVFTIVGTKSGWGKLKSGAGWISLNYTKKA